MHAKNPRTPDSASPHASIVIPAFRNPGLSDCLERIRAVTAADVSFDVTVVLNAATHEVRAIAAAHSCWVNVMDSPANLGVSGGFNAGFARVSGTYLVQLQDDTLVEPGWLRALVERAENEPEVGAVGSLTLDFDGHVTDPGHIVWNDGVTQRALVGGQTDPSAYTYSHSIDYHGSAGMLIRRTAWESIGGLDAGFFPAYYGDVDFCFRLREAGWRVVLEPASRVQHQGSASTETLFREFLLQRNRARFMRRHGSLIAQRGIRSTDQEDLDREIMAARDRRPALSQPSLSRQAVVLLSDDPLAAIQRENEVIGDFAAWLSSELEATTVQRDRAAAAAAFADASLAATEESSRATQRELHAQIRDTHRELCKSMEWAAGLERELIRITSSRSWTATAPLRALSNLIRRG